MNINLEVLGITEESLTKAILSELELTPEEAVAALAERLGVEQYSTTERAVALDESQQKVLKEAGELLNGIFS